MEKSNNKPSISQFDLVEKCFGVQDCDRVICFGYGTKLEDIRGPQPSTAELKAELLIKDRQISDLEVGWITLSSSKQTIRRRLMICKRPIKET